MARLIDVRKLKPSEVYMNYGFTRIVYMDDIDELPSVDAVEVVRCKDCLYSWVMPKEEQNVGEYRCEFWYAEMHGDDYCSCGKRRKDG